MKASLLIVLCLFAIPLFSQDDNYSELMNQDWANLKKYRKANENLTTTPKVVFLGNSITEAWAGMQPEFFKTNNYLGRGIGGQTTPQMLLRFQQDVIDLHPEVVVILASTNDIAGNTGFSSVKMITDNIKSMAQLAKASNIEVILSSILPVYDYPWRPGLEPVGKIAEVNNWLKEYAEENGHIYLDYFNEMKNEQKGLPKKYSEDGVHPNATGYKVMEPLVQDAINKALSQR